MTVTTAWDRCPPRLRRLSHLLGIKSFLALANVCGVSQPTAYRWGTGKTRTPELVCLYLDTLIALGHKHALFPAKVIYGDGS